MDSNLILNPKTNRYVKKSSQTGKRLLKTLATPVQSALLETGAEIVAENAPNFKHLSSEETDTLFKSILLERLSIKPKKKSKYRVVESESDYSSS
jgi:hypothetical protein